MNCIGCGIELQYTNKEQDGYAISKEHTYCKRCFRIRNYNEYSKTQKTSQDFIDTLKSVEKNALVVLVLDIFDLTGSFIENFNELVKSKDVLVVVNKIDLLPRSKKHLKIEHYCRRYCNNKKLKYSDLYLMSAKHNWYIDDIMDRIASAKNNVYIVGSTNVGKSTFINKLLNNYTDNSVDLITTSRLPGTTLDLIKIPFNEHYIIDTPGIINKKSLSILLDESLKYVVPQKEIKPITYQITRNSTLIVEHFLKIDFTPANITCYFSNFLKIHKTNQEKGNVIFRNNDIMTYPTEDLGTFVDKEFTIKANKDEKVDLVFHGLGFITISSNTSIKISLPKKVNVTIREAIV